MYTPQTIVIIGTGAVGKGLAAALAESRYRVLLCGHDYVETRAFTEDLQKKHPYYDIEALSCSYEASWESDMIVLAISAAHQPEVAERIRKVAGRKVVVTIHDNASDLQKLLPYSCIVQAFSGLDAGAFAHRSAHAVPVVAADPTAAELTASLVQAAGFQPQVTEQPAFQS